MREWGMRRMRTEIIGDIHHLLLMVRPCISMTVLIMKAYICTRMHVNSHRYFLKRREWKVWYDHFAGSRYQDKHKGPYPSSSHNGGPPRESGRFQNHRWDHPPRPYNNRHSFHPKPHSEGPVPVGMRGKVWDVYAPWPFKYCFYLCLSGSPLLLGMINRWDMKANYLYSAYSEPYVTLFCLDCVLGHDTSHVVS